MHRGASFEHTLTRVTRDRPDASVSVDRTECTLVGLLEDRDYGASVIVPRRSPDRGKPILDIPPASVPLWIKTPQTEVG